MGDPTGLPPRVVNDETQEAASRTQSSLWDTFTRRSVRHVCCSPVFPLGPLPWLPAPQQLAWRCRQAALRAKTKLAPARGTNKPSNAFCHDVGFDP